MEALPGKTLSKKLKFTKRLKTTFDNIPLDFSHSEGGILRGPVKSQFRNLINAFSRFKLPPPPNPKPLSIKRYWAAKISKPLLLLTTSSLLCLCITLSLPPGKLVRKG